MSISNSLSNALSGMNAASRMAEIVSSNLANSLTEGYGRRTLDLDSAQIGGRGAGVTIGGVNRIVDRGILADRRLADAALAGSDARAQNALRLENLFGGPGSQDSISSRINALETALITAASDPSSGANLSKVGQRLEGLANSLNSKSDDIQLMRADADKAIASQVEDLNTSLRQVEQLNTDITYARNTGSDASSLLDARQRVIDQIAKIVPVREMDRDGGQIALVTPSGETLIDGKAKQFGFQPNAVITADMTLSGGGLSGLTRNGQPIASDGIGGLAGGTLAASFSARDDELVTAQDGLDQVAMDLVTRLQTAGVDPTLANGQAGLLTDSGAAFNPANITGLAGRISVNSAVQPSQGGDVTALRDGLGATQPGPLGDNTILQNMLDALGDSASTGNGASSGAAALEERIGADRLGHDEDVSFASARWASLKEAESANGVDTDYEMQMLLRVEQAYSANARLVQTVESMMQTLMEL